MPPRTIVPAAPGYLFARFHWSPNGIREEWHAAIKAGTDELLADAIVEKAVPHLDIIPIVAFEISEDEDGEIITNPVTVRGRESIRESDCNAIIAPDGRVIEDYSGNESVEDTKQWVRNILWEEYRRIRAKHTAKVKAEAADDQDLLA